ncbi:MAG: hypothetical protein P4L53_05925 [Candidatus Obscuribacterales bacterium]|nr:hypothetical protein [Candidatus Obscuribacterales bacterium]
MPLQPSKYFQLLNRQHADFNLGANGSELTPSEETLWQNIRLYARVIAEAGLESELQEAHLQVIRGGVDAESEL